MGGGRKKELEERSIGRGNEAVESTRQQAEELRKRLKERSLYNQDNVYGSGGTDQSLRGHVEDIARTGGFDPDRTADIRGRIDRLDTVGQFSNPDLMRENLSKIGTDVNNLGGSEGYGRDTYEELSRTGGFSPESLGRIRGGQEEVRGGYRNFANTGGFSAQDESDYLHSATAPITARYNRVEDNIRRGNTMTGSFNRGFTSSVARADRMKGNDFADASLAGRASLSAQKREGKLAGLGGLERSNAGDIGLEESIRGGRLAGAGGLATTRESIERANQAKINAGLGLSQEGRALEGDIADRSYRGASGAIDASRSFEGQLAAGRQAGVDSLARYQQMGLGALSQDDITGLQSRINEGSMTQQDAQLLAQLSAQHKSFFENLMTGIRGGVGALTGISSAFSPAPQG